MRSLEAIQKEIDDVEGDVILAGFYGSSIQIPAARLKALYAEAVEAYDRENPMRTADQHPLDCKCTRCQIDQMRRALQTKQETP